ncbi:fructosamine kinase family protein [Prolixibacteraceae bacterium Z1-6]|uniref:Fructosamine kinase family protein n=1 Tax=Draconibacterium aestuarii TaxID=2998507 RepID=A0A9X3FDL0_9BACT|nr:fructosamine kinase family protein [Prolixibacteraceae bacterium Z1-6]
MNNSLLEIVERYLAEELDEPVKIFSTKHLGGGCINHASKLETSIGPLFLKWNANCNSDIFLREAESLNELSRATTDLLKVPKVFCAKPVDGTPGFMVQEYLQAACANDENDEKLGRGLAIIHQFRNEKFGFYNNNYCGATTQNNSWADNWVDFFVNKRLRFLVDLIQVKRPLPSSEILVLEKLFAKIPSLIPSESKAVLIHGDLWSGNYMNTQDGPALIDPAAYYADREIEFAIMTMFGGFSSRFYSAYNEVHPLEPDWRSRNELYQLYHVLNHFCLFGGSYRMQALSIAKRFI